MTHFNPVVDLSKICAVCRLAIQPEQRPSVLLEDGREIHVECHLRLCPLCRQPVPLEISKTDDHGRAVHEDCYVRTLMKTPVPQNRQIPA